MNPYQNVKMKKQVLTIAATLLVGFSACKKEEKLTPAPKTKTDLLTQAIWTMDETHIVTKTNGVVTFDEKTMDQGTLLFKTDKTGEGNDEDGNFQFTWRLKGDSLYVDDEGVLITKLTETALEVEARFNEPDSLFGNFEAIMISKLKR